MKRSCLLAVLIIFSVVATFAADAAAFYNPCSGRWMQRDPGSGGMVAAPRVGAGGVFLWRDHYADGMNLYQYVGSNPARQTDHTGLFGSVTHSVITASVMPENGVGPKLTSKIVAANVGSDDWGTFLINPYAHALSYQASSYTGAGFEAAEAEDRQYVVSRWQNFVEETQQKFIDKLKANCCDCSASYELGRLTHSWQDRYYHQFHSWFGWHYEPGREKNIPMQEEADLDEWLTGAGGQQRLKQDLANAEQTKQNSNSARAAEPAATAITQKVVGYTRQSVGINCWKLWTTYCEK